MLETSAISCTGDILGIHLWGLMRRFHQRNKAYLGVLSSLIKLITQVGNHAQLCLNPLSGVINLSTPFLGSLKFSHSTISTMYAALYYTVTRYIPFEVYFLMASYQNRATPGRCFYQLFETFRCDRINGEFPSSPTPSSSFLFFVNTLISRTLDARE